MGEERERTREKITNLTHQFNKISGKMTALSTRNDETIGILEKKSLALERTALDLDHEFKQLKFFKKQQLKVVCDDIDSLTQFKGEFQKKSDFIFEKFKEISDQVHKKMAKLTEEFKAVREPIINKVNDISQVAELYH